jgi:phospholipid transport system transporter-binding protein
MTALAVTIQPDGIVMLVGDLSFATINKKTVQLIDFKQVNHEVIIDLAQVQHSDSAGLALIIEWLKIAKTMNKVCRFRHIPPQLVTLANLSGFDIEPYFSVLH